MLRYLFGLLILLWFGGLVRRIWRGLLHSGRNPGPNRARQSQQERPERFSDLTQQEISDADYEEIP